MITPTYSRGCIIEGAYRSPCRQTCKDFERVIADNGSTDQPKALFDLLASIQNGFLIRYYYKENGGP